MLKRFIRQVKKLYDWWANALRHDYDFDGLGLYRIIGYKLERTEKAMLNGMSEHSKTNLKALRIAIKLSKRLGSEGYHYDDRAFTRMENKYGPLESWTTPVQERHGEKCEMHSFHMRWAKAIFEKDKIKFRAEMEQGRILAENAKARDKRNLFKILELYLDNWWD